jgi:hypothetical protein
MIQHFIIRRNFKMDDKKKKKKRVGERRITYVIRVQSITNAISPIPVPGPKAPSQAPGVGITQGRLGIC